MSKQTHNAVGRNFVHGSRSEELKRGWQVQVYGSLQTMVTEVTTVISLGNTPAKVCKLGRWHTVLITTEPVTAVVFWYDLICCDQAERPLMCEDVWDNSGLRGCGSGRVRYKTRMQIWSHAKRNCVMLQSIPAGPAGLSRCEPKEIRCRNHNNDD